MKRQNLLNAVGCIIKAVLISVVLAAFIILISTPGGMEDGVISTGEGIIRMIISFGAMIGAGRLADL